MPQTASHTAHAKVILFGEHSAVYGGPAIALPLEGLTLTATSRPSAGPITLESAFYSGPIGAMPQSMAAPAVALHKTLEYIGAPFDGLSIRVEGMIPAGRGLGSSAAVAAAISGALAKSYGVALDGDTAFEFVQAAEREAHGNPSGLDARAVITNTPIFFRAGNVDRLPINLDAVFVIGDTGVSAQTRSAVAAVADLLRTEPQRVGAAFALINTHTETAVEDLAAGRAAVLGKRMNSVHEQLRELGVSTSTVDALVEASLTAGAFGAKLTGGGLGGCVLALAPRDRAVGVADALRRNGAVSAWFLDANIDSVSCVCDDHPRHRPEPI